MLTECVHYIICLLILYAYYNTNYVSQPRLGLRGHVFCIHTAKESHNQ